MGVSADQVGVSADQVGGAEAALYAMRSAHLFRRKIAQGIRVRLSVEVRRVVLRIRMCICMCICMRSACAGSGRTRSGFIQPGVRWWSKLVLRLPLAIATCTCASACSSSRCCRLI